MVELRPATAENRDLLRRLLADYLHELDGTRQPYRYFDAYWTEPERLPFLIETDGDIAGFCLIRLLDRGWHIAEFSVLPDKRRGGVGRAAVEELAPRARADGATHLEANVFPHNRGGLAFWQAAGFEVVREDDKIVTRRAL